MKVVMIGTGNVATVLSKLLVSRGHQLVQVYGRNAEHAAKLASDLNTFYSSDPVAIDMSADLYMVALSDTALYSISSWFKPGNKLVVHTAGSVSMDVLSACSTNFGVLYPLQSLRKEMETYPVIPLLIEGNTPGNSGLIKEFAKGLSDTVVEMNSEDRMRLHIGAVMVSNFTNYLYARTDEYYKEQHLDFKLLLPLMRESVNRLEQFYPSQLQTGPAVRNDQTTIQKHLQLLADRPDLAELYKRFSEEIREYFK